MNGIIFEISLAIPYEKYTDMNGREDRTQDVVDSFCLPLKLINLPERYLRPSTAPNEYQLI